MASSQHEIAASVTFHPRKDAAKKLMDTGIVSRVDADEAANVKKADIPPKEAMHPTRLSAGGCGKNSGS